MLGFSAPGFAIDTEFVISGPLFGLRSPIENPPPYYVPDAELLNYYGGAFSTDIGPVFVNGALFYSSGGVIGFNPTGSRRQNIEYTDYSGRIIGGYRLYEIWRLDLYFGGAFGYGSAKRISDTRYEPADENEYPPYSFVEKDDSILTRYFYTGGPIIKLDLYERIFVTGYIGIGSHRASRRGVWHSKYSEPPWPEYYRERVEYDDTSNDSTTQAYINFRIKLFSFLGIAAGAEKIYGPEPTIYGYIPESVFMHWIWDEPTYFLWFGPYFSF